MNKREWWVFYGSIAVLLFAALAVVAWVEWPVAKPEIDPTIQRIERKLDSLRIEVEVLHEHVSKVVAFAEQYDITPALAATIYRTAREVGIEPRIAFNLVWVESRFNPRAVSPVGAVGLAQVMPATARILQPGITRDELFDPETNLRLGFTYLKDMLRKYDGDIRLALLAYNRGPGTVDRVLAMGQDPNNGYADWVLAGI